MKNKILILTAFSLALLSCQRYLDIEPTGGTLSQEQVDKGATLSKEAAEAAIPGAFGQLKDVEAISGTNEQDDFGLPAYLVRLDCSGDNLVSSTNGYNWFASDLLLGGTNSERSKRPVQWWNSSYKGIKLANDVLLPVINSKDPSVQSVKGRGLFLRAFHYFNLVRLFQKTYKGNENADGVPIVKHDTPLSAIENNPRASVKDVYAFILEDLDGAIKALEGFTPEAKNQPSQAVAYGLRARVYLTMEKYKEAYEDAEKAIKVSRATPFSIDDCSIPNFDDVAAANNIMWGLIYINEDRAVKRGLINFSAHFNSLVWGSLAYPSGANEYKTINTRLYDLIPKEDVRKGWWVVRKNGGTSSPLLDKAYPPNVVNFLGSKLPPYAVVKFAPNNKDWKDPFPAADYPLMRVEEMYYIMAEAKGMLEFEAGKKILEDFEKKYRNPAFASKATDGKTLADEIYTIKRYEFWAEGISWFDMLRLKKGIDRVDVNNKNDGGYPKNTRFNIDADNPILILQIPRGEIQYNKAIKGHQNPLGDAKFNDQI